MIRSTLKPVLIALLLEFVATLSRGQSATRRDTLYYLLDIKNTRLTAGIITAKAEPPYIHYVINSPDLQANKPSFRENVVKKTVISKASVRKMSFITLPDLIDKIKAQAYFEFKWHYVVFFIAQTKTGFTRNKVYLEDEAKGPSSDIHIDSVPRVRKSN